MTSSWRATKPPRTTNSKERHYFDLALPGNWFTLSKPYLSIVIPAHNEALRLPATLEQVRSFLHTRAYSAEVIVVENGSCDGTLEIARSFMPDFPELQVIHEDRRGKGLAVWRGMLAARGEYRLFADADLSMPITEVDRFLPPALNQADIAIASREAPGAVRYNEPAYRHLVGRAFNSLVRWIALPGLQDTQCGFKCFREEVVETVFPYQTLTGWSFDVELLFVARRRGYRIIEVPIPWYFNPESKVRVFKDSLRMGLDLLTIRRNALRGLYDRPPGGKL